MRFNGFALALALTGFLFLASAPPAQAVFELVLADGAGNSITLNSITGCTAVGATSGCGGGVIGGGFATYVGFIGTFVLNVTTGTSKPITILPTLMDLNSINIQANPAGGGMVITWSDTGWFAVPQFQMTAAADLTAPPGSSITYDAYYDAANAVSATTTLIGTLGPFAPGAFLGTLSSGVAPPGPPYSLTQKLTYVFTGSGISSGDYELVAIPEPATVALLGGVLLLTCGALRRRLRRS